MKIYLVNSLCKRCPYFSFKQCHYKMAFYNKIPKVGDNIKLVHKCTHYQNIYKKGQHVLIDLYDQVMVADGKWKYTIAFANVPGIIKGRRGSKFIVELFEAFFLNRKKKGESQANLARLFMECTRAAKDIKPLVISKEGMKHMQKYRVRLEEVELMLS